MHIHRTKHAAYFTILSNVTLRKHELSFTARGLLGYLLSLPPAAREDIRTLAKKSVEGRKAISNALHELEAAGHYLRVTVRDPRTGLVRTRVDVYEVPPEESAQSAPVPVLPGTGAWAVGRTGSNRSKDRVSKDRESKGVPPSRPEADVPAQASRPLGEREAKQPTPDLSPELVAAAGLLARIGRVEPRVQLGTTEAGQLAPLVLQWQDRGASDLTIRNVLTDGLPAEHIFSPLHFLRSRLTRKLPDVRPVFAPKGGPPPVPTTAPQSVRHTCGVCGARQFGAGLCGPCRRDEAAATPEPTVNEPDEETMAVIREYLEDLPEIPEIQVYV